MGKKREKRKGWWFSEPGLKKKKGDRFGGVKKKVNGFWVSFYFFGLGSFMLIKESVHVARSLGLRVKKKKGGKG